MIYKAVYTLNLTLFSLLCPLSVTFLQYCHKEWTLHGRRTTLNIFTRDPANYDVYHAGLATFYPVFCISCRMIFSVLQDWKLIRSREHDEQPKKVVHKLTIVFNCIF